MKGLGEAQMRRIGWRSLQEVGRPPEIPILIVFIQVTVTLLWWAEESLKIVIEILETNVSIKQDYWTSVLADDSVTGVRFILSPKTTKNMEKWMKLNWRATWNDLLYVIGTLEGEDKCMT